MTASQFTQFPFLAFSLVSLFFAIPLQAADIPQPLVQFAHDPSSGDLNGGTAGIDSKLGLPEGDHLTPNPGVEVAETGKTYTKGAILSMNTPSRGPFLIFQVPSELSAENVASAGGMTIAFWLNAQKLKEWGNIVTGMGFFELLAVSPETGAFRLRTEILNYPESQGIAQTPDHFIDQSGWAFYTIVIPVGDNPRYFRNGSLQEVNEVPILDTYDPTRHKDQGLDRKKTANIGGNPTQNASNDSELQFSNFLIFSGALDEIQVETLFNQQFTE